MKKLLLVLLALPLIGFGQVSILSNLILHQIERNEYGKSFCWITDNPLKLPRTSSFENVTPQFEAIDFYENEVMLTGEFENDEQTGKRNVCAYPTFGRYKIFAEKNIGKINEEGLIIISTDFSPELHSPSGVDNGTNLVINYRVVSETELLLSYDNKKAFFYEIRYDQIK